MRLSARIPQMLAPIHLHELDVQSSITFSLACRHLVNYVQRALIRVVVSAL